MQFSGGRGFADAQLDAAMTQEVEGRDPFGDASGMVRRQLDDAVPEPNVFCALRGRGQEDLGRGRMGVFLEEVVLDFPGVLITESVRELDLFE